MLEVTATFLGEKFRRGDFIIGKVASDENGKPREEFSVKGTAEKGELELHKAYRYYGRWGKDYENLKTGEIDRTFDFETFIESQPHSRAGVIKYLASAGKGLHLGPMRAAKLWERFGANAVQMVREQPEVAAAVVTGWQTVFAVEVAEILKEKQAIEATSIELMALLDKRGFPKGTAKEAIQRWGNLAAAIIERNPYFLMLMLFRGCGFKLCDAMYLDLGLPAGKLKRQALCAWYSIASDSSGNTWYPISVARDGIKEHVSGAELKIDQALDLAKRARLVDIVTTDQAVGGRVVQGGPVEWIAERKAANAERSIAHHLVDSLDEEPQWPFLPGGGGPTEHQLICLGLSMKGVIGILGGSPGTGKTFTAAALIKSIINEFGSGEVAICAPTGKAAVRITEVMLDYGIDKRARTIHSTLGVQSHGQGEWTFEHDEGSPLPFKFIIVDESSMIDTGLMRSFLAARARGTHVLFVGDINQLLPVGHGAPLRDMIDLGIAYGELREVRRNSGAIVQACADMRDGKRFEVCDPGDFRKDEKFNLAHVAASRPPVQLHKMLAMLDAFRADGFDPVWGCQVVTAVNKKSELARKELNQVLQGHLNTNPGVDGSPFRLADKIVNTKNGYFPAVEFDQDDEEVRLNEGGDEVYVANGELAKVIEVTEKLTIAELTSPDRTIKIPRGKAKDKEGEEGTGTGCSWELGYCLSVHKSQGSEWPVVIVMIDEYPGAKRICDRSWYYTAFSRAKRVCVTIGKINTVHTRCQVVNIDKRKTLLVEWFRKFQSENLLAEM